MQILRTQVIWVHAKSWIIHVGDMTVMRWYILYFIIQTDVIVHRKCNLVVGRLKLVVFGGCAAMSLKRRDVVLNRYMDISRLCIVRKKATTFTGDKLKISTST